MRRSGITLVAVGGIGVILSACGGGGGGDARPTEPAKNSISISPHGLTLKVGGHGTLTATVTDASGATMPGPSATWASRASAIASVDNNGSVTAFAVGSATVVASANGKTDSVLVIVLDDLILEVQPAVGSVNVGGTFPFTVVARNSAGQVIATPVVAWSSGSPSVATIGPSGIAAGLAKGTALITASARGVTSPPAVLTVTDVPTSLACDGISSVDTFNGSLTYDYAVHGLTNGGFAIDANYHGDVKATLKRSAPTPLFQTWSGPLSGSATLHETKSDPTTAGSTTKLDGSDGMVNVATFAPTMSLIVNLQTCTYQLTMISSLALIQTEPNGTKSSSNAFVATVNVGNTTPLGNWRGLNAISDLSLDPYDGHSSVWAVTNLGKNSFVPLGFAGQLMAGGQTEAPVGGATVTYVVSMVR